MSASTQTDTGYALVVQPDQNRWIWALMDLDAVITWNYKHLANIRKSELFFSVNLERGFHKKIEIITPWEVVGYVES